MFIRLNPLRDRGASIEILEQFNASVTNGKSLTAEKPKSNLAEKINLNGKLYAFYPLTPSITMVHGGLMINKDGQVTEADGTTIKGPIIKAQRECRVPSFRLPKPSVFVIQKIH